METETSIKGLSNGLSKGLRLNLPPPAFNPERLPPSSFIHSLLADDIDDNVNNASSDSDGDMSGISSILSKISRIKPPQGRYDRVECDEKIRSQLSMIDLYVILTDPAHEPSSEHQPREVKKWKKHQRRLRALQLSITDPIQKHYPSWLSTTCVRSNTTYL